MSEPSSEVLPVPCSTTFDLPGYRIEHQGGLCWGVVVRSIGFAKGFTGSIRALRAGEVDEYTSVLEEARRHVWPGATRTTLLRGSAVPARPGTAGRCHPPL